MKQNNVLMKKHTGKVIAYICRYVFLIAFSYILLYPLIYIAVNSLLNVSDYFDPTVEWVPKTVTFDNFKLAIKSMDFGKSFLNTLVYEMVAALLEVCSCAVAAYGLARFDFKGKKLLNGLMILTILVPTAMIIIPSYVNFRYMDFAGILGLISKIVGTELRPSILDTPLVFWLPSVLGVGLKGGLFIYIYMQFFKGLPREFEEAAWLDGAGPWKTFLKVIVPSSSVPVITVLLFSVVWHWNEYYTPQMYLSENFPLSVKLANISDLMNSVLYGDSALKALTGPTIMAGCFMCIVPMLIFYLCFQKKFIASIANSGIVG